MILFFAYLLYSTKVTLNGLSVGQSVSWSVCQLVSLSVNPSVGHSRLMHEPNTCTLHLLLNSFSEYIFIHIRFKYIRIRLLKSTENIHIR